MEVVIYQAVCTDMAQGCMKGTLNEKQERKYYKVYFVIMEVFLFFPFLSNFQASQVPVIYSTK